MKSLTEYINEQQRVDEMGPKTAAITRGANAKAKKSGDDNYEDRADKLDLDALNHAFESEFDSPVFKFHRWNYGTWHTCDIQNARFKRLDRVMMIMECELNPAKQGFESGCFAYEFKTGKFHEVRLVKNHGIRRLRKLEPRKNGEVEIKRLLDFCERYLLAADSYTKGQQNKAPAD